MEEVDYKIKYEKLHARNESLSQKYSHLLNLVNNGSLQKVSKSEIKQLKNDLKAEKQKTANLQKELEKTIPCNKVYYSTKIEAELAISTIQTKGTIQDKTPHRYYHCHRCNGYHLTAKLNRKYS